MITDTKDGQTNHCPNCEDQARRIEELERRERVLIDALQFYADGNHFECEFIGDGNHKVNVCTELGVKATKAINATPTQSEAWEWNQHVEWMKKQGSMTHVIVKNEDVEIIALAKECGAYPWINYECNTIFEFSESELLAFAKSIQDKQREEDAKICDMRYMHTENTESRRCADIIRSNKD